MTLPMREGIGGDDDNRPQGRFRSTRSATLTMNEDVILGAGLAGLTAAYTLQELGESAWQTYEREDRVGGHARSIEVDGYTFDFGPHILFAADPEIGT